MGRGRAILLLVGWIAIAPAAAHAQARVADSVTGIDKMKHFLMAGFVESVAFAGLQAVGVERRTALGTAAAVTVTVSVGREFHDRRTSGLFSFGDLLWDVLGAGAAMLILTRVQK